MMRRFHRIFSLLVTIPFFAIVCTGVLLQCKRWLPSIQPPSQKSEAGALAHQTPPLQWENFLESLRGVKEAEIERWGDVKAIDIRPALGVARVRSKAGYEIQVDLASGKVLSHAKRLSSLLVEIHEGSFFGPGIRDFVFVPCAFLLLFVFASGLWMLITHYSRHLKRRLASG